MSWSVAIGPDGRRLYIALAKTRQVLSLDARSLESLRHFPLTGEPRAALPSSDGRALFVAVFDRNCVLRLNGGTGAALRRRASPAPALGRAQSRDTARRLARLGMLFILF